MQYEDLRFDDRAPDDPTRPWVTDTPGIEAALGLARLANQFLVTATRAYDAFGAGDGAAEIEAARRAFLALWRPFADKVRVSSQNQRLVAEAEELDRQVDALAGLRDLALSRPTGRRNFDTAHTIDGHAGRWIRAQREMRDFVVRVHELERLFMQLDLTSVPAATSPPVLTGPERQVLQIYHDSRYVGWRSGEASFKLRSIPAIAVGALLGSVDYSYRTVADQLVERGLLRGEKADGLALQEFDVDGQRLPIRREVGRDRVTLSCKLNGKGPEVSTVFTERQLARTPSPLRSAMPDRWLSITGTGIEALRNLNPQESGRSVSSALALEQGGRSVISIRPPKRTVPPRQTKNIKRMSIDQIPPYDRDSKDWVPAAEAAAIEGVKRESLGSARSRGDRTADGMAGCDKSGRAWRRIGTKTSHPFYLVYTLTRYSPSR